MSPIFFVIAALICGALAEEDDPYRLPPNYIVNHQDIDLVVPAEAFTADYSNYSGSVDINFQVRKRFNYGKCKQKNIIVIYLTNAENGTFPYKSLNRTKM